MKPMIKLPIVLALFAAIATAGLAFVYHIANPIIQQNQIAEEADTLAQLYPSATFELYDSSPGASYADYGITSVYAAKNGNTVIAYLYRVSIKAYKGGEVRYLLSIDTNGIYRGFKVLVMEDQTSGIGTIVAEPSFSARFLNQSIEDLAELDPMNLGNGVIVSGATRTTQPTLMSIQACGRYFQNEIEG